MTEILGRMASIYRHKIRASLLKSRLTIENLSEAHATDKGTQSALTSLGNHIDNFDEKSTAFLSELPNYIKYQNIGVKFAINEAAKELDAEKLESGDGISIVISAPENEIYVYASQMLKEHIYNLANNNSL